MLLLNKYNHEHHCLMLNDHPNNKRSRYKIKKRAYFMNEHIPSKMAAPIQNFHLPRYQEIPDVGLYLEQTAKYIDSYLSPLEDISITGSMISNYVKKKIISNPVKKQYGRDQIASLIFIAVAKSVLSLDNIHMMFEIQRQTYDNETAYNYFCREFEQVLWHVFELDLADAKDATDHDTEKEHGTFSNEKTMLRNMIITVAHKIYLDRYFSLLRAEDTI